MKFHERFNIQVNLEESKKRFVNRIYNDIFLEYNSKYIVSKIIATTLGKKYSLTSPLLTFYISYDFFENLEALEGVYEYFKQSDIGPQIDKKVLKFLNSSEVDLGISWENGRFLPTGAKLMDEKLINENLNWLRDKEYLSVLDPFEKGLNHFLHSTKRKELYSDVIREMYESLEALSKIITGRENKDLSANRDLLLKQLKASDDYKIILKDYIEYANKFRHAAKQGKSKPNISKNEVESFIYLTGIFIRFSIS